MTNGTFDRDAWEKRWEQALREHPDKVASRTPNEHLLTETSGLQPGRALDAGCGHGAEALCLAMSGWKVTAIDFSPTALQHGQSTALAMGADVAERITWVEGDLGSWTPPSQRFDLVSCLYVHVAGSVHELVTRLGSGVAPGGTLLLVGHAPIDPATGKPTPAAGQVQVSVAEAIEALDPNGWQIIAAEERPRAAAGTGVDAVIRAVRRYRADARENSSRSGSPQPDRLDLDRPRPRPWRKALQRPAPLTITQQLQSHPTSRAPRGQRSARSLAPVRPQLGR